MDTLFQRSLDDIIKGLRHQQTTESAFISEVIEEIDGRDVRYSVPPNASLSRLIDDYCSRRGVKGLKFFYNGKRVTRKHTAAKLGLENEDQIEAMMDMHGGGCKASPNE
ncbi:unnamed protein product [Dovyalis caffra]|uniref:Ubiquitin-like domain-containing protein n=1 Tax=Dovyalis caffra TaxID=77055 RepID=A0AAV1QY34_9ROSI|nr:unnamed protein product [Dovyalis caffra]